MSDVITVAAGFEQLKTLIASGHADNELVVSYNPGKLTVGAWPAAGITGFSAGFDWNAGRVFAGTALELGVSGNELSVLSRQLDSLAGSMFSIRGILKEKGMSPEGKLEAIQSLMPFKVNSNGG